MTMTTITLNLTRPGSMRRAHRLTLLGWTHGPIHDRRMSFYSPRRLCRVR